MVFFNDCLTQVLLSHLLRFMLLANPTPVFLFYFYLFFHLHQTLSMYFLLTRIIIMCLVWFIKE